VPFFFANCQEEAIVLPSTVMVNIDIHLGLDGLTCCEDGADASERKGVLANGVCDLVLIKGGKKKTEKSRLTLKDEGNASVMVCLDNDIYHTKKIQLTWVPRGDWTS